MDTLIKLGSLDLSWSAIILIVIIAFIVISARYWWPAFFDFKIKAAETGINQTQMAFEIQNTLLATMRRELKTVSVEFEKVVAALKAELKEVTEKEEVQQKSIENLRTRLKQMEETANRWEERYHSLNSSYEKVKAKLEVYENVSES